MYIYIYIYTQEGEKTGEMSETRSRRSSEAWFARFFQPIGLQGKNLDKKPFVDMSLGGTIGVGIITNGLPLQSLYNDTRKTPKHPKTLLSFSRPLHELLPTLS